MDFLDLRCQCGVSHEVRRGASHVAPGIPGLHAHGEGERVIALQSCRGIGPQDALKKDSPDFSRVAAGNPGFPRLVLVTSGSFSGCLLEVRDTVNLGGASRDSTGFDAMEEGLISS